MADAVVAERARELAALHAAPQLLVCPNAWDVASAQVVVAAGAKAVATASHSIAAVHGFADGERTPLELVLAATARIVDAVGGVPVTADLEAGYGDPGRTVRRAVAAGVVGCNLEDAMAPREQAVAAVAAAVAAGAAEGVPVVVNARTDVFLRAQDGADREALVAEAIARGRAFHEAGAACVFVPGVSDAETITRLVDGLGAAPLSVLAGPGAPTIAELQRLGVARASVGPWSLRAALGGLRAAADALLGGGSLPDGLPSAP